MPVSFLVPNETLFPFDAPIYNTLSLSITRTDDTRKASRKASLFVSKTKRKVAASRSYQLPLRAGCFIARLSRAGSLVFDINSDCESRDAFNQLPRETSVPSLVEFCFDSDRRIAHSRLLPSHEARQRSSRLPSLVLSPFPLNY